MHVEVLGGDMARLYDLEFSNMGAIAEGALERLGEGDLTLDTRPRHAEKIMSE